MCTVEEKIRQVRSNKAYVFDKKKFMLTFALSFLITFAGAVTYLVTISNNINNNSAGICGNTESIIEANKVIDDLKNDINKQILVQQAMSHNIEMICRELGIVPLKSEVK